MKATLVFLAVLALSSAHSFRPESGVVVLDDKNFAQNLKSGSWLLLLYAPWCGHCQRLIPTWEQLPQEVNAEGINIGAVDCDANKDLCSFFAVRGMLSYPMLRFVDANKQVYVYSGDRSKTNLLEFVRTEYVNAAEKQTFPKKFIVTADL